VGCRESETNDTYHPSGTDFLLDALCGFDRLDKGVAVTRVVVRMSEPSAFPVFELF
jgi:hypothetical protein